MLFHPDPGEMSVWIQMTGELDGGSQETERRMSRPGEQSDPSVGQLGKRQLNGKLLKLLLLSPTCNRETFGSSLTDVLA